METYYYGQQSLFPVEVGADVGGAAHATVILSHTPAEPHSSVASRLHQCDLHGLGQEQ